MTTKEGKQRFATNLHPETIKILKSEAAKQGKDANDIIEELVKEKFGKKDKK